ncbi:hypothetical protein [Nitrobacter sp. JJSN]|uniref:hypothetical protein n=1 Tax=Nitrobacter sp. JJSN TaxID=3453033 RepID=UPI003F774300
MYPQQVSTATQSNSPQYFIFLKNGRWRPVDVPAGEAPLAIWYRGCWRVVFRAESDAEFFAAHPEAKFRLLVRPSKVYRDFFMFKITTRDPDIYADGDAGDWRYYDAKRYGTPLEFLKSECDRMLAHPHRCSNPERWLASQAH